jgi:uncharacterized membrane protein HdeD (DUF308 family)
MGRVTLLATGALLLVAGFAVLLLSNSDPALLFIIGAACSLMGIVHLVSSPCERGAAVSAGSELDGVLSGEP